MWTREICVFTCYTNFIGSLPLYVDKINLYVEFIGSLPLYVDKINLYVEFIGSLPLYVDKINLDVEFIFRYGQSSIYLLSKQFLLLIK